MKILLALAAVSASATMVLPTVASARIGVDAASATVSYADLDLAKSAGRAELQRRIGSAVRQLCGTDAAFGLNQRAQAEACASEAFESADRQLRRGRVEVEAS